MQIAGKAEGGKGKTFAYKIIAEIANLNIPFVGELDAAVHAD